MVDYSAGQADRSIGALVGLVSSRLQAPAQVLRTTSATDPDVERTGGRSGAAPQSQPNRLEEEHQPVAGGPQVHLTRRRRRATSVAPTTARRLISIIACEYGASVELARLSAASEPSVPTWWYARGTPRGKTAGMQGVAGTFDRSDLTRAWRCERRRRGQRDGSDSSMAVTVACCLVAVAVAVNSASAATPTWTDGRRRRPGYRRAGDPRSGWRSAALLPRVRRADRAARAAERLARPVADHLKNLRNFSSSSGL